MNPGDDGHEPVTVIGAGITGLTSAIRLEESGFDVTIVTTLPISETTSANAGAIWGPFLSTIDDRLARWSYRTLDVLRDHATDAKSGVTLCKGLGAEHSGHVDTWWVERFAGSDVCDNSALPSGYERGWRYTVPIIDMPKYLEFLATKFLAMGGYIQNTDPLTASDLQAIDGHVVICAGFGAAQLVNDPDLSPSKGQLVVVENRGITDFFAERGDGPELTYILPQGDQVVLGGTAEPGRRDTAAEVETTQSIIERCSVVDERLKGAKILSVRVGVRACRDAVRLEHSDPPHHYIFNYGHGGSGVSLSWACAEEVAQLVESCCDS